MRRESLLRVGISEEDDGKTLYFRQMKEPCVLFDVRPSGDVENWWIDELQNEIELKFDNNGPLWRAIYYTPHLDDEEVVMIFSFHHSAFDGGSIMSFYDKFLSLCNEYSEDINTSFPDIVIQPLTPSIFDLWKYSAYWWIFGCMAILKLLWTVFTGRFVKVYSDEKSLSPGFVDKDMKKCTRIYPFKLDSSILQQLKLQCKEHNVTIHSALSSASILGYFDYYNSKY